MGSTETDGGETVNVSQKGQATIPQRFREKFGITAPGRVRFEENEEGELVVRPIRSITAFRGAASTSKSAAELLEEGREADREREERLTSSGEQ